MLLSHGIFDSFIFSLFTFIFCCYSLTFFVYWNLQKITKKRKLERASFCSYSYFGTNHFDAQFFCHFIFMHFSKYDISSHVFKHVIKCDNFNEIVFGIWLRIFQRRTLSRVTLVSVKESWGIRILLNTMRSTQVFNEILYKNSHFIQRRYLIKNVENKFCQNEALMRIWILRVNFRRRIPTASL